MHIINYVTRFSNSLIKIKDQFEIKGSVIMVYVSAEEFTSAVTTLLTNINHDVQHYRHRYSLEYSMS